MAYLPSIPGGVQDKSKENLTRILEKLLQLYKELTGYIEASHGGDAEGRIASISPHSEGCRTVFRQEALKLLVNTLFSGAVPVVGPDRVGSPKGGSSGKNWDVSREFVQ